MSKPLGDGNIPVAYSHPTTEVDLARAILDEKTAEYTAIQRKVQYKKMGPEELEFAKDELEIAKRKLRTAEVKVQCNLPVAQEIPKEDAPLGEPDKGNSDSASDSESGSEGSDADSESGSEGSDADSESGSEGSDADSESEEDKELRMAKKAHQMAKKAHQVLLLKKDLKRLGKDAYHSNQCDVAKKIVDVIISSNDPKQPKVQVHQQCIAALTQSGKTGVIVAILDDLLQRYMSGEYPTFDPEAIYVLGNVSSLDWLHQTKNRMPDCIQKRVYHLAEFKKKLSAVSSDAIIFVDEAHMCASLDMTFNKVMDNLGLKNYRVLCKKRIHFMYISATPMNITQDMNDWHDDPKRVIIHMMEPGEKYTGLEILMKQGRILKNKSLYCNDNENIREFLGFIERKYKKDDPRYHIVRLGHYKINDRKSIKDTDYVLIDRVKATVAKENDHYRYDYEKCDCKSAHARLIPLLGESPARHTFVFIKNMAREAITLPKQFLGTVYESESNTPGLHTVVQSLSGRTTGYDVPDDVYIFTNIERVKEYLAIFDGGFKPELVGLGKGSTYTSPKAYGESSRQGEARALKDAEDARARACWRVPLVFDMPHDPSSVLLSSTRNLEAKVAAIKTLVKATPSACKALAFLDHANCKQVSQTKTPGSCDRKIHVPTKKRDNGDCYQLDFQVGDKKTSVWEAFVENQHGRMPPDKSHSIVIMFWVLPQDRHMYPPPRGGV